MITHLRFTGSLAVVAVFAVACSSGKGSTVSGEPVPASQIGQKYAEKVCPAIAGCCSQNGFAEEHKSCMNVAAAIQTEFDKDQQKGGRVYDAQRAGNCLAKIAAFYGTCGTGDQSFDSDDDEDCENMLTGSKGVGEACTSSNECGASMRCYGGSVTSGGAENTGKCARVKVGAAGDPCFSSQQGEEVDTNKVYGDCSTAQLYCDTDSKTCKTRGGPGTACASNSAACDRSSYCDVEAKSCKARVVAGGDCGGFNVVCADSAYCDSTKKCVAKKAPGESCGAADTMAQCQYGCDSRTQKCQTNEIDRDVCAGTDAD